MAITTDVKNQLFRPSQSGGSKLIRLPSEASTSPSESSGSEMMSPTNTNGRAWTAEEHNRFLEGLELFPSGPWKEIAAHVGSRTTRQTMTHAQKYREKIARRKRGLRSSVNETLSLKRRRDQQHEHSRDIVNDAASPCSVAGSSMSTKRSVNSMDFHECFVPRPVVVPSHYQFYGMNPVTDVEFLNFAATLIDFDPLPMSGEEIDFVLEVATLQPSAHT